MKGPVYRPPPFAQSKPLNMALIRARCAYLTGAPMPGITGRTFTAEAGNTYQIEVTAS